MHGNNEMLFNGSFLLITLNDIWNTIKIKYTALECFVKNHRPLRICYSFILCLRCECSSATRQLKLWVKVHQLHLEVISKALSLAILEYFQGAICVNFVQLFFMVKLCFALYYLKLFFLLRQSCFLIYARANKLSQSKNQ